MQNFFAPKTNPRSLPSIRSALATKKRIHHAHLCVARWWFDANISFNAANSNYYQVMWDAISTIGPDTKVQPFMS